MKEEERERILREKEKDGESTGKLSMEEVGRGNKIKKEGEGKRWKPRGEGIGVKDRQGGRKDVEGGRGGWWSKQRWRRRK